VFLASPRTRTFVKPNCRMITRNGCSTFVRALAFAFSILSGARFARPSAIALIRP
jgi:hypothetical protein